MVKQILIDKCGNYFHNWKEEKLQLVFSGIDIEKTKKYALIKVAKKHIYDFTGGKKLTCLSIQYYTLRGHSVDEAKFIISKIQSNNGNKYSKKRKENPEKYPSDSPMRVEFWIKKGYNLVEAKSKINSFRPVNSEYWVAKGFTPEEANKKIIEFQTEMSNRFSKKQKENPGMYDNIHTNQINYWIDKGLSEEEAILAVKERQKTFSLQKCIEKFGEEEGIKKFEDRQRKWKASLFQNFDDFGDGRSKQSQWASKIIDEICMSLKIKRPKKEKWISSTGGNLRCSYDFTYNKKIIEFNGDHWHANPKLYDKDFFIPVSNIFASVKWNTDQQKIELAKSHGYEVLVVWESEYKENPEHIIIKCLNFLQDDKM